ncbi:MAG TPA: hypothetical protein VIH12_02225 [Solibacillus sp.]
MNLTNNAQRVLEYVASKDYSATAEDIYSALHIDKTVLLSAIYKLVQNGLKVTTTSDNQDIQTVSIKKTRVIKRYLEI